MYDLDLEQAKCEQHYEYTDLKGVLAEHNWCKYNKDLTGSRIRMYNLLILLIGIVSGTQLV